MNNGFIKLFRCIEDSFFWNDSQAVHLWIQLLLSANHRDKEMLLSGEKVIIKSGHFVCSRNTLSLKTGINESKVQRILKVFESEQMIEQQMNSKYRMISISNWNKYQGSEQVNEQQMNSKRTADEQQMNTNNNNKNDKNEENKEKDISKDISKKKEVAPPNGVDEQVWNDWMKIRKAKRVPITETALHKFSDLAKDYGFTISQLIEICIERGWASATDNYLSNAGYEKKDAVYEEYWNEEMGRRETRRKA